MSSSVKFCKKSIVQIKKKKKKKKTISTQHKHTVNVLLSNQKKPHVYFLTFSMFFTACKILRVTVPIDGCAITVFYV